MVDFPMKSRSRIRTSASFVAIETGASNRSSRMTFENSTSAIAVLLKNLSVSNLIDLVETFGTQHSTFKIST